MDYYNALLLSALSSARQNSSRPGKINKDTKSFRGPQAEVTDIAIVRTGEALRGWSLYDSHEQCPYCSAAHHETPVGQPVLLRQCAVSPLACSANEQSVSAVSVTAFITKGIKDSTGLISTEPQST